jgi:HAD superfamily hydrolase (TIGR01509 family)
MTPAAVVFDCDGTLVDSEPLSYRTWERELAQHGYALTAEDVARTRGFGFPEVHRYFAQRIEGFPDIEAFWPRFSGSLFALIDTELPLFEDAIGTARELRARGMPIAIASSSPRERVDRTLAAAGLTGLFDVTVAGDEVERGKPAPDLFLAAAEQLGVPPHRCVAVEDSPVGVESALAAGMTVVAVARLPEHRAHLEPHLVHELTAAVVEAAGSQEAGGRDQ